MLKDQLTILTVLSSFVLGGKVLQANSGEPVKNALSGYAFDITRRNNESKFRALIDIKRHPSPNVTNSTISLNGSLVKTAREEYHDDGEFSGRKLKFC